MRLFGKGNGIIKGNGIAGPLACKTCPPSTTCFAKELPLGKTFEDFTPQAQQKLEELRQLFGEGGAAFRSGKLLEAAQKRNAAQDKAIEIIQNNLVPEKDFGLFSQTVLRMISMHAGSPAAEQFLNSM